MKIKKRYILTAMLGLFLLPSCTDFMQGTSPSEADADFVFSNTEDALAMLEGVYVKFCEDPFTSRMSNVWMQNTDVECMGPSSGVPSGAHRSDIWALQAAADESFSDIYKAWNNNYEAIDFANQVIEGIKASSIASNSEMEQMLGEAYCLKAYRYFLLCNFWGDVPYYDSPATYGDDLDKPKTDKNIIYSQCLQDLVDVEGNMKFSDVNTGGIERMPRDFALGLIAKLALFRAGYGMTYDGTMQRADDYLDVSSNDSLAVTYTDNDGNTVTARTYTEYYQMAKNYAQKLINLKPRTLRSDFAQIFKDECEYTVTNDDDVLYEVAFVESYGGDVGWCIGVANTGTNVNGTTTDQVALNPAYYMSFADNDARRDVTCARYQIINDTIAACGSSTNMFVGKWDRSWATKELGSTSSKGTGINWPLMRYSDVLLMLAEAENELNGPTTIAKNALTTVRARAFADSPTYAHDVTDYVDSVATSKDDFFNAIVNERAWEFGGECIRRFDLVRWNNYGEEVNKSIETMNNWAIASDTTLLSAVSSTYPDAANYSNWADKLYYSKTTTALTWLNDKYKETDETATDGKYSIKWGSNLLKTTTTYIYNSVEYTACVKTTVGTTVTYALSGNGTATVTATTGEYPGITKKVLYSASDFATRLYRGYTGGTGTGYGTGVVPYLLPIGTTTLSASSVLNNDGYGFSSTYTGDDVNVDFTTISTDYK